jgi:hypothetical protein
MADTLNWAPSAVLPVERGQDALAAARAVSVAAVEHGLGPPARRCGGGAGVVVVTVTVRVFTRWPPEW